MQALDVVAPEAVDARAADEVVVAVVAAERRPGRRRRTARSLPGPPPSWSSLAAAGQHVVALAAPEDVAAALPVRVSDPWPPRSSAMSAPMLSPRPPRRRWRRRRGSARGSRCALVGEAVVAAAADVGVAAVRWPSRPRRAHGTPSR